MPLFEFECSKCKHIEERIVEREVTVIPCSKCNAEAKKIMSCGSFIIKGFSEKNGYSKTSRQ